MYCPVALLSFQNGIYCYQVIDCSNPSNTSTTTSSSVLTLGCSPSNPACTSDLGGPGGPGDPGGGAGLESPSPLRARRPKKSAVAAAAAEHAVPAHIVRADVARKGLVAPLPADAQWELSNAVVHPDYAGNKAYHVLRIDGKDRHVRLLHATVTPPACLALRKPKGKSYTHFDVPSVEVRVGQECVLPEGVKPRLLVLVERHADGDHAVVARPRGKTGATHEFHIVLAR